MNEKIAKIKNRIKSTIKEHAPEIIAFGTSALALVAYSAYVMNHFKDQGEYTSEPDNVAIITAGDEHCYMVLDSEAMKTIEQGQSEITFDFGEDQHFKLTPYNPPEN